MSAGFDRPLVSDEEYLPCHRDSDECVGQVTADGCCDAHRVPEQP
jgi:hypothetical protein